MNDAAMRNDADNGYPVASYQLYACVSSLNHAQNLSFCPVSQQRIGGD